MAKRRLPSLSALKSFEAAARHLSFRAAAEELAVTHSAISHQVKALEAQLGVMLFRRGPQSVSLTEAGAAYYPVLREAFDRIAEGTDRVQAYETPRELTVQVYITVAISWLVPRLHSFQQRWPDIQVRLATARIAWDFDPEHADIGIVMSKPRENGLHWEKLAPATLYPVCHPSLLEGDSAIRTPEDLRRHRLLKVYTTPDDWSLWAAGAGLGPLEESESLVFDSYILAYEAAMDRQGVAIAVDPLARPDMTNGRLVRPLDLAVSRKEGWYLVCRPERVDRPAVRAFRNWMHGAMKAEPPSGE